MHLILFGPHAKTYIFPTWLTIAILAGAIWGLITLVWISLRLVAEELADHLRQPPPDVTRDDADT